MSNLSVIKMAIPLVTVSFLGVFLVVDCVNGQELSTTSLSTSTTSPSASAVTLKWDPQPGDYVVEWRSICDTPPATRTIAHRIWDVTIHKADSKGHRMVDVSLRSHRLTLKTSTIERTETDKDVAYEINKASRIELDAQGRQVRVTGQSPTADIMLSDTLEDASWWPNRLMKVGQTWESSHMVGGPFDDIEVKTTRRLMNVKMQDGKSVALITSESTNELSVPDNRRDMSEGMPIWRQKIQSEETYDLASGLILLQKRKTEKAFAKAVSSETNATADQMSTRQETTMIRPGSFRRNASSSQPATASR